MEKLQIIMCFTIYEALIYFINFHKMILNVLAIFQQDLFII